MSTINWTEKLASRKFWAFLATFTTALIVLIGYSETTAERISALIIMLGDTLCYIFGEAQVDISRKENISNDNLQEHDDKML